MGPLTRVQTPTSHQDGGRAHAGLEQSQRHTVETRAVHGGGDPQGGALWPAVVTEHLLCARPSPWCYRHNKGEETNMTHK